MELDEKNQVYSGGWYPWVSTVWYRAMEFDTGLGLIEA